jgi:hypothetical protein
VKGLRRFFASGGKVVVVEAEYLDELEAAAATEVAFRQNLSGHEMLVVVPTHPGK